MSDLQRAKQHLTEGGYTCVLCKGDSILTSNLRGVAPMVEFLLSGQDLKGYSAADKIVGKAPALLFVLAGVKEVYAPIMTHTAVEVLSQYGIAATCEEQTDMIQNRTATGPCPMERTVGGIEDPQAAFEAIQVTLAQLKKG